jgi:hypothetical protein
MIYIKFDEDGIQEETRYTEESPGADWYPVNSDIDGKFYKLSNGAPVPMTKKQLEDYRLGLRKTWVLMDARIRRDRALMESDWTQLPSSPLSDAKKAEWETYRQALRDFPSVVENDLEAVFPAQP